MCLYVYGNTHAAADGSPFCLILSHSARRLLKVWGDLAISHLSSDLWTCARSLSNGTPVTSARNLETLHNELFLELVDLQTVESIHVSTVHYLRNYRHDSRPKSAARF